MPTYSRLLPVVWLRSSAMHLSRALRWDRRRSQTTAFVFTAVAFATFAVVASALGSSDNTTRRSSALPTWAAYVNATRVHPKTFAITGAEIALNLPADAVPPRPTMSRRRDPVRTVATLPSGPGRALDRAIAWAIIAVARAIDVVIARAIEVVIAHAITDKF
jgi:hypothetical protein